MSVPREADPTFPPGVFPWEKEDRETVYDFEWWGHSVLPLDETAQTFTSPFGVRFTNVWGPSNWESADDEP